MKLDELRIKVHNEMLDHRRVTRLLNQEDFGRAYNVADKDQQQIVLLAVEERNIDYLKKWLKNFYKGELESLNMPELYILCRRLGIKRYSRKSKGQLIKEIRNAQKRVN